MPWGRLMLLVMAVVAFVVVAGWLGILLLVFGWSGRLADRLASLGSRIWRRG
jgi:hypothetical protein